MSSQSEITTSIDGMVSAAEAQGLTAAQMQAICRRAIATALALGGTSLAQITIGGQQYSINLEVARQLEQQYREWAMEENTDTLGGMGFGKLQGGML